MKKILLLLAIFTTSSFSYASMSAVQVKFVKDFNKASLAVQKSTLVSLNRQLMNSINLTLPVQIDKVTILTHFVAVDNELNYKYKIETEYAKLIKFSEAILNETKNIYIPNACTTGTTEMMFNLGYNALYTYYSADNKFVGSFNVNKRICQDNGLM